MTTQNRNFHQKKGFDRKHEKPKENKPITSFDLFTGGKTPALAVFYNLAFSRVAGMVYNALDVNKNKREKEQLEKIVDEKEIHSVFENWLEKPTDPSGTIFPKLRDYLWKGYQTNKNSAGYEITADDKSLIVSMLKKLNEIRNFYSHIYHDNVVVQVEERLRTKITKLHKHAYLSFQGESPKLVEKYELKAKKFPFFSEHEGKWFFKGDGRIFFLSLFLTSGEMSRFLQQCKNYKLQSCDLDRFVHKVFRFYTHRDGAARQHYGHTENILNSMEDGLRQQTRFGQQAYKLISYLNDVPLCCRDTALQPLYLDNKKVQTLEDYTAFCQKYNLFKDLIKIEKAYETKTKKFKTLEEYVAFCQKYKPSQDLIEIKKVYETKNNNDDDDFEEEFTILKENYLKINILDKKYSFLENENKRKARENNLSFDEANYDDLHKINIATEHLQHFEDSIADKETMPLIISLNTFHRLILDTLRLQDNGQTLKDMMSSFVEERKDFYRFLYDADFRDAQLELYKMNDETEYYQDYFRFKLRNENLSNQMSAWRKGYKKGIGFERKVLTMPIELDYYNFFYAQERKIRKQDGFMRFAIRYLIDFQIVNWYWMFERFEVVAEKKLVEKTVFGQTFKNEETKMVNKRHVVFSKTYPKGDGWRLAIDNEEHILVAHFDEKNKEKIGVSNAATHKFSVGPKAMRALIMAHFDNKDISAFFIPLKMELDALKKGVAPKATSLIASNELPQSLKVKCKLQEQTNLSQLKTEANHFLKNQIELLDKVIAQDAEVKKWRRAEKNRFIMQCYTFFDWKYPNQKEQKFLRKDEYQNMSIYHYCLDKKKKPNGDFAVKKLEYLVKDALKHIPKQIENWLEEAQSFQELLLLVAQGTKKKLENFEKNINQNDADLAKKTLARLGFNYKKEPQLPDFVPFAIHPMLVLKKFYNAELKALQSEGLDKPNNSRFSLSKAFYEANKDFEKKLISDNYQIDNYLQMLENEHLNNSKTNIRHIKGEVNDTKIQDLILAKMADKYLENASANYRDFLKIGENGGEWQAKSMRKTTVKLEFKTENYGTIALQIRFHQLDDYLLAEGKEVIRKAIEQVLKRLEKDEKFQRQNADYALDDKIIKTEQGYKIPYEQVFKEIQRVYNHSLRWATHLLEWERNVIQFLGASRINEAAQKIKGKPHINFTQVCDFAQLNTEEKEFLNDLRKHIFHAKIPSDFTYWELAKAPDYEWLRKKLRYNDAEIADKYK